MSQKIHVTEKEAMEVAEASRQTEWTHPSFMREPRPAPKLLKNS